MAAAAIPAVDFTTDGLAFCCAVLKTPPSVDEVDVAELPLPVPVAAEPARVCPGVRGMAGSM